MVELDDLERIVRIGLLYDYYGPLLTAHQREAINLYYLRNWSLQEIAESWATSRQAVHDLISRAVGMLESYESRLSLEARDRESRSVLQSTLRRLDEARGAVGRDDARVHELLAEVGAALAELLGQAEDSSEDERLVP